MAQNITIAGATYTNVPAIDIAKSSGGLARFVDTSNANASASDLLTGKTAYVNGALITGEYDSEYEERIAELEETVVSLQDQIDALEARVAALEAGGVSANYNAVTGDLELSGGGVQVDNEGYLVLNGVPVDDNGILTF